MGQAVLVHELDRGKATPPEWLAGRHGDGNASWEQREGEGGVPVETSQDEPVNETCLTR